MQRRIALHDHGLFGHLFHLDQRLAIVGLERFGHIGIHPQHHVRMLQVFGDLAHFEIDLVANRGHRFHEAGGLAIRARRTDGPLERLLHSLARDGHQSEVVKLQNLGRRAVAAQGLFQRLHDFLAVAAFIHVDEIDHDDAAQIAQPDLAHDFLDGIDVGLDDGVFEARRLADVLAGVDVDRDQRFGLVDDDVAATLQPDFRLERFVDLLAQAELLEERNVSLV